MTHSPMVLLVGLIGQFLLPCEGIALRTEPAVGCMDAVPGDSCHKFVSWALEKGLEKHPDWFPSFKRSSSEEDNFKQIQEILHSRNKAGCDKPCFPAKLLAEDFGLEDPEPPAAEIQKTPDAEAQATPAEAPAAEEAKSEAAPEQSSRSNLIGTLQAEVKALEAMKGSPSLETLRAEKRQLIHNLWSADKLEAELKAKHLQTLQTVEKSEAELKALEAMETTAALEILRSEKRALIEKLQTADKSDAELKAREIQRLQDPAAAAKEAAPAAPAEEVRSALAQQRPQEEERRPPRSDLVAKLEAELKAMDQIHHSPALDTLRAEKRQLINNLQTADKLEEEFKARQLEDVQKANTLEADLKTLEAMDDTDTPTLETLRAEKRALLENLQAADKSDTEQTRQELQRLQDPATAAKDAAPAAPAAVSDPEPAAADREPQPAAADRKPWWQRRWREARARAVREEQQPETPAAEKARPEDAAEVQSTTDAEAQASAAAVEEAKPEAVPAAPAEEAKPAECMDAAPGDRCHEFVTWALEKGLVQHPDWFPSFQRSESGEQNFKQMQGILHSKSKAGCGKPC